MSTVFNGVDQYLTISGLTAGVRVRMHMTPLTPYILSNDRAWYDSRTPHDGSGYGFNSVTGSWTKSGMFFRIGGTNVDPLLSTTMDDGTTEIELDIQSSGAGSSLTLFANAAGTANFVPMTLDAIEIRDSGNVTVIHNFDLTSPTSATVTDTVGSAVLTLEGFTFPTGPITRNITLNGEATHEVIQTMTATANTTVGESIFGTGIIIVENDMQAYVPKTANGMNITWAADGTFTTDANQTETITVSYFSPSTEEWSCLALTIQKSSIISSTSFGFDFPNFQFPLLFTTAPATLGGYSIGFSDGYEV